MQTIDYMQADNAEQGYIWPFVGDGGIFVAGFGASIFPQG